MAVAIQPATGSPMRLPNSSSTTAPAAGSAGTIHDRWMMSCASTRPYLPLSALRAGPLGPRLRRRKVLAPVILASALQEVDVVGGDVLSATEDGNDDRQTDGDFGGGDD